MRTANAHLMAGALMVGALLVVALTPAAACASAAPVSPPSASYASAQAAAADQLVDRIVAIVDGEVITLGQLRRALALASTELGGDIATCGQPGAATTPDDTNTLENRALDCMIDGLLMFQHVRRFPQFGVRRETIDAAYADLVAGFPTRDAFEQELRRWGLSLNEVRYDLERQLLVANYIQARYRDLVDVRDDEVRRYYDEVLAPEMERTGEQLPALEAVEEEIRLVLRATEVNRRVEDWIADLRRRADIVVYLW